MRDYIYKVVIFAIAIVLIFEFTIGKEISKITETEQKMELVATYKEAYRASYKS